MAVTRLHLSISGRVQGVNFRYMTRQRAGSLGLSGWVRNAADGSVEVEVQGPEEAVQQFVAWAHRGPPLADVERVDIRTEETDASMSGFHIIA